MLKLFWTFQFGKIHCLCHREMEGNQTSVTEFILLGFPLTQGLMLLFGLFSRSMSSPYWEWGQLWAHLLDSRLHTPMYFFLSHLAIVDMAYACSTVPQMLVNLLSPAKPIPFAGCITQTFFWVSLTLSVCSLVVMSQIGMWPSATPPLFGHHELESLHHADSDILGFRSPPASSPPGVTPTITLLWAASN